jgi:hypothetical protein
MIVSLEEYWEINADNSSIEIEGDLEVVDGYVNALVYARHERRIVICHLCTIVCRAANLSENQ